jgi:hypothetical protein
MRSPKRHTLSWDGYLGRSQGPRAPYLAQLHGSLLVPEADFSALEHYARSAARPLFQDVTRPKLISALSGGRGK